MAKLAGRIASRTSAQPGTSRPVRQFAPSADCISRCRVPNQAAVCRAQDASKASRDTIQSQQAASAASEGSDVLLSFFLTTFLAFGYVLSVLPPIGPEAPYEITGFWKFALIATHVSTFVLIPVAMRVFYTAAPKLKLPARSIFATQLGFAFVMVSIASEIGWHVTQNWYYTNDYTLLNFMFYFFLISGFALWAEGLRTSDMAISKLIGAGFALGLLAVSVLYPLGASLEDSSYKIPIYVTLTVVLAAVTYRGWKVLDEDPRVALFPILSVGVNLGFIALLAEFGTDVVPNALFHISHDLFGTLAGVAVFTWLVYEKGVKVIED